MRRRNKSLSFISEIARVLSTVTQRQLDTLNKTLRPLPTDATPLVTLTRDAAAAFWLYRNNTMPLMRTADDVGAQCSFSNPVYFGALLGYLWEDYLMRTAHTLGPECTVVVVYRGFVLAIPQVLQAGDSCFDLSAYKLANTEHFPTQTHEAPKYVM